MRGNTAIEDSAGSGRRTPGAKGSGFPPLFHVQQFLADDDFVVLDADFNHTATDSVHRETDQIDAGVDEGLHETSP